jgi:hypothetical protein
LRGKTGGNGSRDVIKALAALVSIIISIIMIIRLLLIIILLMIKIFNNKGSGSRISSISIAGVVIEA